MYSCAYWVIYLERFVCSVYLCSNIDEDSESQEHGQVGVKFRLDSQRKA